MRPVRWMLCASIVGALMLTACGGDDNGGGSGSAAASGKSTQPIKLKMITPGTGAVIGTAALAQALGYFKEEGLDVSMDAVASSSVINSLVSGSANVAAYSVSAALVASSKGQDMTMLYGYQGNHQVGTFIAKKSISSLDQLKAMPKCKIATNTIGSSYYGYSQHYIKSLGLKCSVTQFSDTSEAIGGVVSGAFDAGAFSYGDVIDLADQGKVNLLIDTSKPEVATQYNGPGFTTNAWFAKSDWVKSHQEAVDRMLKAFSKVDKALHSMTPEQLGAALHGLDDTDWNATSAEDYATQFKQLLPFMNPDSGYISETNWNTALQSISTWGLDGFKADDPKFAYGARVDMSRYESAIGPDPKS